MEGCAMPTGVHLHDPRKHLFDAAERVLSRDGPSALTSRAVTLEAGVAKGVLHRHFADFDAFLVELVQERVARVEGQAAVLRHSAGTGTVTETLTGALVDLFVSRDELRRQLREARPSPGIPILTDAGAMIAAYLADERAQGRIAADADVDSLALSLIGAGHLLFADRQSTPPDAAALDRVVSTVIADVLQRRLL
jgi:AcrR family transcriptional regulator